MNVEKYGFQIEARAPKAEVEFTSISELYEAVADKMRALSNAVSVKDCKFTSTREKASIYTNLADENMFINLAFVKVSDSVVEIDVHYVVIDDGENEVIKVDLKKPGVMALVMRAVSNAVNAAQALNQEALEERQQIKGHIDVLVAKVKTL